MLALKRNRRSQFLLLSMFSAFLCLGKTVWAAPTLSAGSASGQAGTTVNLQMNFDPTSASVAGMQFNVTVPAGLSTGTVTGGAILTSAVKSVNTNLIGNTWTFIIFGINQTAIPSGPLLTAQMRIGAGVSNGTLSLPISNVVYTDPSGQPVTSGTTTGGSVTVYSACDLDLDGSATAPDVQLVVNQALGVTSCTADLNKDSRCDVIDVQRVVNAVLGGACVTP